MKKFLLSGSLILSFAIYSMLNNNARIFGSNNSDPSLPEATPSPQLSPLAQSSPVRSAIVTPQKIQPAPSPAPQQAGLYKNGDYAGSVTDAYYGLVRIEVVIQNGKIAEVRFLQYPNDRQTSLMINKYAMPILISEAIQSQNAQVDIVSGATQSSEAFRESLASALTRAKI